MRKIVSSMSEGAVGLFVLLALGVVASIVSHRLIRNYLLASLTAAAIATVAFQLVAWWRQGYLDPFFPIALVVGGVLVFVIALIVGIAPRLRLRNKNTDPSQVK
jgi:hypothetical protein